MFYPAAVSGDFRACWLCASRRACCAAYESVRCTVSFPAGMTAVCIRADSLFSAACRQETLVSFAGAARSVTAKHQTPVASGYSGHARRFSAQYKTRFCRRVIWQNAAESQLPPSTTLPCHGICAWPTGTLVSREVPLTGSVSELQTASQLLWENLAGGLCFHWLTRLG